MDRNGSLGVIAVALLFTTVACSSDETAPTTTTAEATQLGLPVDDLIAALIDNPKLLKDILLYHVVPGNIPAADMVALSGQKVKTLSGESWTVNVDGETVTITDGFGGTVNV
ncbi:MAG: hypothetical protein F2806_06435, partial [Actinobacteria bacterium]|nr:hypothetical protein [Actinomycetota bacterium]